MKTIRKYLLLKKKLMRQLYELLESLLVLSQGLVLKLERERERNKPFYLQKELHHNFLLSIKYF